MIEDFAKGQASKMLLNICYFPFVAVGGITVSFYDIAQMDRDPITIYSLVVGFLHVALWVFWWLIFKRLLVGALQQMSFSKTAAKAGLLVAYAVGLFIGWLVHKYA
jgi:hypothetical protein